MKIKQFEVAGLAQYSYVLSSEGEAIVIDPMRDFDRYTDYAREQGLAIRYVTETHIHADFVSGAMALAEASGARLLLSSHDQEPYLYSMGHHALRGGDVLRIGKLRLSVLHTPGHTPEHLSFVLFDEQRDGSQPLETREKSRNLCRGALPFCLSFPEGICVCSLYTIRQNALNRLPSIGPFPTPSRHLANQLTSSLRGRCVGRG